MIHFDKLDKTKTYVCLEYGTGKISKLIQKFTKDFCYNQTPPSHVFALVYDIRTKDWIVYESHAARSKVGGLPSGTRKYSRDILEKVFPMVVLHSDCYQADISKDILEYLLGRPYGLGDIERIMRACLVHRYGKQRNAKGLICSEYIANCFEPVCYHFNLPPHCITPAHFKAYFIDKGVKPIE